MIFGKKIGTYSRVWLHNKISRSEDWIVLDGTHWRKDSKQFADTIRCRIRCT